jgi:hypothetical protein
VHDAVTAALAAEGFPAREAALVRAFEEVARRHNALGLTAELDVSVRGFHGRPFRVLASQRFADACYDQVSDPWLRSLPPVGSIDQLVDTTDVLSYPQRARRIAAFYESDEAARHDVRRRRTAPEPEAATNDAAATRTITPPGARSA